MLKITNRRSSRSSSLYAASFRQCLRLEDRLAPSVSGLSIKGISHEQDGPPLASPALNAGEAYWVTFSYAADRDAAAKVMIDGLSEPAESDTIIVPAGHETASLRLNVPSTSLPGTYQLLVQVDDSDGRAPAVEKMDVSITAPPTVSSVDIGEGSQRSMVKKIVVNFSEPVDFMGDAASAFLLRRRSDGNAVELTAEPKEGRISSVTLTFAGSMTESGGSLVDGSYELLISSAQISARGSALDGNGDGLPGGEYDLIGGRSNGLYRLFGDSNGDGSADQIDYLALRRSFASQSTVFDFNDDGNVDQMDYLAFRERIGSAVE